MLHLSLGIAQGVQRSTTGVAMILGPLWGGSLTSSLYLMFGVMFALQVIFAVRIVKVSRCTSVRNARALMLMKLRICLLSSLAVVVSLFSVFRMCFHLSQTTPTSAGLDWGNSNVLLWAVCQNDS